MISLDTPILDQLSGHLIRLSHHRLIVEPDLELTQEVTQEYFTNEDGQFGIPLLEAIGLNSNLTPEQKDRQRAIYQTRTRSVSTRGYKVDPVTQEVLQPDESGQYPEGAIDEKLIWISVLASQIPGDTISEKVFALIVQSMAKMAQRNRI